MALRAVFREIRRAAVRLDGRAAAVGTLETTDRLRQSLNLKAWLLPEPFSPEAIAYARGGSDAPWQRLVHYGTRRALRACGEQSPSPAKLGHKRRCSNSEVVLATLIIVDN